MVKVPQEVRQVFERQRVIPMATADASGKPNVVYVGMWWWENGETIVVVDNFLNKTRRNLEENPRAALVGWDREARRSYQVKCGAEVRTSGDLYEKGHRRARGFDRRMPGKAVVVLRVEEVYQASPGKNAGDRLL